MIVSNSFSDDSSSSYHRPCQCSGQIRESKRRFHNLHLEAILGLLVGVTTRLTSAVTLLRFADASRSRHISLDVLRVIDATLVPLSETIDELTALEAVLDEHRQTAARRVRQPRQDQR
jgi:hypothetical protein